MARCKVVDRSPRFLPIVLDAQLMPGSFEYALNYLIDNEIDLPGIAKRDVNDETGAPAYDPAVMLKIVLLAYTGITPDGRKTLVIWRKLTGEPERNNLENLKTLDDTWKLRPIEADFHRLMFKMEGV